MSEISQSSSHSGTKVRSKKISTRIDMTPMVDLAFLLLTFFVLTAKLAEPYVLPIDMPVEDDTVQPPLNEKNALTLIPTKNNKILWYEGSEPIPEQSTNFSRNGIRKLIGKKMALNDKLYIFIKPADDSQYSNLIDILDEMRLAEMKRYCVVDVSPNEKEVLKIK